MMLLDHLRQADPQRTALADPQAERIYGQMVDAAQDLRRQLRHLGGLRLFIIHGDVSETVLALAALDGIAGALVLASPMLDAETAQELARRAEADAILTDRPDLAGGLPLAARAADLAALPGLARGMPAEGSDWVLTTSGTTGRPKLVAHALDSLTRTTRRDQIRGRGQVWGLLYDHTRFAGLQVVLQALLSGATLAVAPADMALDHRLAFLAARGVTHLSATPTLWRKILMTPAATALSLRQITLGGEVSDDAVLSALARQWPQARISHIFASTEAGVGFSVTDGRAGFPESFLHDPPLGIGLRVEDGRLLVRNDRVASQYLGGDGKLARDGWVDTGDLVRIQHGRVLFLGRGNGVINVGGDKVHPEEIESVILTHPDVAMVQVYAKRNPIMGALVAADIQPRPGLADRGALRDELKAWLAARLDRHKVPAFIRIVDSFETNAAGKLKRGG
ncbi:MULTISPECIES: class I adenylate-forming enzyme family protein [unclassified Paracoccus (in: a-proteobacteria)]|uniref:class I adenylate-forming enzyme family protein n=1 Tax=unclassified Paracoccus (in: a-proteobacteria) TaxID=2688777 RepID=UPI0012B1DA8B|nr:MULTISPECIES: fatty acid--CoA ligase family protein [unclassified Paracoccus (in: a-proteobacteria)]UXU74431.1 fatty acid--CoA ligase family protein [Paracoccus sp. SMMA_5]UXU80321.1 fatty acid--CoA ligase family protein [Paracoccus sp. SMMA_5_TC]